MFISPSKLRKNRVLKDRTITFETSNKIRENMVIIATDDKDLMIQTINSQLFKPTQLMCFYTPRMIKPRAKGLVKIDLKDYYGSIKEKTLGRIKKCKIDISAYRSQNLIYDIYNSYVINRDALSAIRQNQALQIALYNYFEKTIKEASSDPDYKDGYIVFPMGTPYKDPQKTLITCKDFKAVDPLSIFLLGIDRCLYDPKAYENIKCIFVQVPKYNVILALDMHDPDFTKNWGHFKQKLRKLNSLLKGEEGVDDVVEKETDEEVEGFSHEDVIENKKEEIKKVVLDKFSKDMRTNLSDYEAASSNEKDLIVSIDDKVEKYIEKKDNLKKTVSDMVEDLEKDEEIKSKAIKFIETKKAAIIKADTLSKGLEKETEIVSTLQDIDDPNKTIEPSQFKVDEKDIDPRIERSRLAAIDEEYNKKQMMTDISNSLSGFSGTSFYPMTLDNVNIEDVSNYSDEKYTYNVRYKTNEGKPLSFQLDVPKMVDNRYLYLGGDKKVIKKQLIRLPIVKTKEDRVELTSNTNKMTIDRTNGKISRKNAYILKKLKEIGKTDRFYIEYGDNTAANSKLGYSNDFAYEELAGSINYIKTIKYELFFNRDSMRDELDLLDINVSEDYFSKSRTPLGFTYIGENKKDVIFIENNAIFTVNIETGKCEKISDSLFDFLVSKVLGLDMSILPSVGKAFVYTRVKFLATTYPLLSVVASQNGLTNILDRYVGKGNYYKTQKLEKNNTEYIGVKFKDCYLYYKDEPKNSLLLNSIYLLDTENYNYAEFDADIPYTHYFMRLLGDSVGMHTRNTLRINLEVYVDPITRDILRDLKLPTDIIDILLYANTLLVGNQYKPLNDMSNYRIRSNELIPALMYSVISDAYVNYEKHRINGRPMNISVPKNALIKKLMEQPNVNSKSTLSPILEVEQIAQASAKGWRGVNIDDAYTLEMRAYDDSMYGFISGNSTPYSGQVGITRALTYDPQITSVRGYIPYVDKNTLSAVNVLSPTELLSSFTAAGADAPRQAINLCRLI